MGWDFYVVVVIRTDCGVLSVLIPCIDSTHLEECLSSFSDDLQEKDEVLLYLDGDYEKGKAIAKRFKARVVGTSEKKKGPIGAQQARNILVRAAKGDYILHFDADDYRIKGTLRQQIEYLNLNPDWDGVFGHFIFLWKDPLAKGEVYQSSKTNLVKSIWEAFYKRSIQTGCVLWRKKANRKIMKTLGYVFNPRQPRMYDSRLVLDALKLGCKIGIYPSYTHYYRWGWSRKQHTQRDAGLYGDTWIELLNELIETVLPDKELEFGVKALEGYKRQIEEKMSKRKRKALEPAKSDTEQTEAWNKLGL